MPIYEYRCASCQNKSSFFARSVHAEVDAVCPHCGSDGMQRVISRVSFKVSAGTDPEMDYYKDRSKIGRHVEDSFKRFGVDMPDSVRKTLDNARRGKTPEGLDI